MTIAPPGAPPEPPAAPLLSAPSRPLATFDPSFGQGPRGPLYLPAGPPGTPSDAADAVDVTPGVVVWFRLYVGFLVCQFLALAVFGLSGAASAGFKGGAPQMSDLAVGIVLVSVGAGLAVPHLIVLVGGRRPWVHPMGTVLLALSIIGGGCCAVPAIFLLLSWTNQETTRWFKSGPLARKTGGLA